MHCLLICCVYIIRIMLNSIFKAPLLDNLIKYKYTFLCFGGSMSNCFIPEGYKACLDLYETQKAITVIKRKLESEIEERLNLKRVSAPLFVDPNTGLNDNLNGTERAVRFNIPSAGIDAEVIHSLAKWKRMALYRYDFNMGKGLYTNMNAIRRDETLDNLHSVYVDQWDWEKIISIEERNEKTLKETVRQIAKAIKSTHITLRNRFPQIRTHIEEDVYFISSQELLDMYPHLPPKAREYEITKKHGLVFISQIGKILSNGERHDGRSPDYDDWELNGDILYYHAPLDCALEISSMGIRVDAKSLDKQLRISNCDDRRELAYHKMLLNSQLPLTIGGGIGQSRLCMLLMGNAHIGEVQSSIWDEQTNAICQSCGVILL